MASTSAANNSGYIGKGKVFTNIVGGSSSKARIVPVTCSSGVTRTLTLADSGSVFMMGAVSAALNFALPAISGSSGATYKFVLGAIPTAEVKVTAATAVIGGTLLGGDGNAGQALAASSSVAFDATNSEIGDYLEFVSNGTVWACVGVTVNAVLTSFTVG
jgi:hypothetical protein